MKDFVELVFRACPRGVIKNLLLDAAAGVSIVVWCGSIYLLAIAISG